MTTTATSMRGNVRREGEQQTSPWAARTPETNGRGSTAGRRFNHRGQPHLHAADANTKEPHLARVDHGAVIDEDDLVGAPEPDADRTEHGRKDRERRER